jgi:putative SOS response-associated peptidase YedK
MCGRIDAHDPIGVNNLISIHEKPSFRKLIRHARTIPVNGFYEWQRSGASRRGYHFSSTDDNALALGAIYQIGANDEHQCCIVTTAANGVMAPVHDRMPVIIAREAMSDWLRPEDDAVIEALMQPCPNRWLCANEVSSYVNNARNEGEHCIEPIDHVREKRE